jgi:hypothetical protein
MRARLRVVTNCTPGVIKLTARCHGIFTGEMGTIVTEQSGGTMEIKEEMMKEMCTISSKR